MIIRVEHAWAIGYCSKGMRQVCLRYGLNWIDIVKNGIEEEELLKFDNQMMTAIVENARGVRQEGNVRL